MNDGLASFEVLRDGDLPVLRVCGEVDLSNATSLRAAGVDAVAPVDPGLVVDITDLGYLDSAGIRALFELQRDLESRRQRIVIVAPPSARVHAALVLTGVPCVMTMHHDVAGAQRDLSSP